MVIRMLKIDKNQMLNDEYIECICMYETKPIENFVKRAKEEKRCSLFRGPYGFKSLIILRNNECVVCPFSTDVYLKKLDESRYYVSRGKKYIISKKGVKIISKRLSESQQNVLAEAKKNGLYINLSSNKKVKYYFFMDNGHIYGCGDIVSLGSD